MTPALHCELISWSEVQRLCLRLANLVRELDCHPDIVVAIGRGGFVPARLLSDYLDIMALTSIKIVHNLSGSTKQEQVIIRYPLCTNIENQCVLLVHDVNGSGAYVLQPRSHGCQLVTCGGNYGAHAQV